MQQGARSLGAAALTYVKKEAARVLAEREGYSAGVMKTVEFAPDKIVERKEGMLSFPWSARRGAVNAVKSAHGGALSTLADAFTRVHLGAVTTSAKLTSVSFEISFLSAIVENTECTCLTRLVSLDVGNLAFMDFSFEDEMSGQVFARGTHVLCWCG
ncbi:putative Thioesterase superfamily [Trypanosoma cruzi]|uniref:Putative Thioesterase superfamily n=1 Tax=Trypanosoma cruzi TaxID=5693 RepID=A0A2V2WGK3_TRYCR|nr:putative Thioesterase superfamily [Trypanosoma cruzi]